MKKMKKEEKELFIRCCILGAIGGILMAAGDWLSCCDDWYVGDKSSVLEKSGNQMQI